MQIRYEISGKFDEASDCNGLLYAPLARPLTYRRSRSYEFDCEGSEDAVTAFVRKTLLDESSQQLFINDSPWHDEAFLLDYGMKASALDLEKESILSYYRSLKAPGFTLKSLAIRHRIYVFGDVETGIAERFVRDMVNPAIHTHRLTHSAPAGSHV